MKKSLAIILCLIFVFSSFGACISVSAREFLNNGNEFINDDTYVLGDADGDGEQNGKDALAIKATVAGLEGYFLIEDAADFNGDGVVDAKDSYLMKTCLSGTNSFEVLEGEHQVYNLTIGENPITDYSIVLPNIPDINECNASYAAEEMQTYIEVATGVRLEIVVGEATTPHAIRYHQYFVDTPENIEMGLRIENYKYTVTDGDLDIYGSLRGNMYATYEILEKYLGFRFISGEYTFVYKNRTVDIPEGCDVFFAPKLNSRWTGHTFAGYKENYHYPRKSNGDQSSNVDYYGAFTGQHFMFGHSYAYCWQMGTGTMPDESFGALSDRLYHKYTSGETHDTLKWQPCASSEKEYQTMFSGLLDISRMISFWGHVFRNYEEYSISSMSFSFEDNKNFCQCRYCTRSYKTEGYSGTYVGNLVNRAAREIQEYYPGMKLCTILYDHTVPKNVKPDEMVILYYCGPACNNHALGSGGCGDDLTYLGDSNDNCCTPTLKGWGELCRETGAELWFYYYPVNYHFFLTPCPNIMEIYYDLYYMFNECNVTGMYYEGAGETYNFETLKAYLASLMQWEPEMTYEQYIEYMKEYLYIRYGGGYEYIYEYTLHSQNAGDEVGCFINNHDATWDMYSWRYIAEHYEEMRELLVRARELCVRDDQRARVDDLIMCCDTLGLSAVYEEWYTNGTKETKALYEERYAALYGYIKENNIRISDFPQYIPPATIDFSKDPISQFYNGGCWDSDDRPFTAM